MKHIFTVVLFEFSLSFGDAEDLPTLLRHVIESPLHSELFQEDCEYEYESFFNCFEPFNVAFDNALQSLPDEIENKVREFIFSDHDLTSEEIGDIISELLGENTLCTQGLIQTLPLLITCVLPSCINCENESHKAYIEENEERWSQLIGCEFEVKLCEHPPKQKEPASSVATRNTFLFLIIFCFLVALI
eukprot:snap_masked-scaffold_26-processed-gene-0.13-mRNA-1 protein AED:1.00 eAED:1.00 QI:0/-1/0/0/-1/1/1/0/188